MRLLVLMCSCAFVWSQASTERSVTFKYSVRPSNPDSKYGFFARVIGGYKLNWLDPFLLFDHFKGNSGTGFRDHPHRGFETVSYLLSGKVQHEDFMGKKGVIEAGDTQWITAGKGVMHAEAMVADSTEGFQLWVNLRSTDKMIDPSYQELPHEHIPTVSDSGVNVTIIAGESLGVQSPTLTLTKAMYLDVKLAPGAKLKQAVPQGWNGFLYVIAGDVDAAGTKLVRFEAGILSTTEGEVVLTSTDGGRVLLLAGEPLNEPMVPCGYFVMNSATECRAAESDFTLARNGFEAKANWHSETQKLITH